GPPPMMLTGSVARSAMGSRTRRRAPPGGRWPTLAHRLGSGLGRLGYLGHLRRLRGRHRCLLLGLLLGHAARTPAYLRCRSSLRKRSIVAPVPRVDLLLPAALLLGAAADGAVPLGDLLGDEARTAARAGFRHRSVPGDELARRVCATAVEYLPAPRTPLHHLARGTREAFDARGNRFVERLH